MLERLPCYSSHGLLPDVCKDCVQQLREESCPYSCEAIFVMQASQSKPIDRDDGQRTTEDQRTRKDPHRRILRDLHIQGIDDVLEYQRHLYVKYLAIS